MNPEIIRTFTLKDLADAFNRSEGVVRILIHKNNLPYTIERNDNYRKEIVVSFETYLWIKDYYDKQKKKAVKKEKQEVEDNFDELKKVHPLVTNPMWFRQSAFPKNVLHACDDLDWRGY